jgi:integrase
MSTRRSKGEGSVGRISDGRWRFRRTIDGKTLVAYGKTRAEALKAGKIKVDEHVRAPRGREAASTTVPRFVEWWRDNVLPNEELAPSTIKNNEYHAKALIESPEIAVPLNDLKPSDVRQMLGRWHREGVAQNTIRLRHNTLDKVLRTAVTEGILSSNVMDNVKRPSSGDPRVVQIDEDKLDAALAILGDAWRPMILLTAATGMRRGEVCGLQWGDVDLEAGELLITRQLTGDLEYRPPKGKKARRVPLGDEAVEMLRRHRLRELEVGLMRGYAVDGTTPVFTSDKLDGAVVRPASLSQAWNRACRKVGLEDTRIHDLRHRAIWLMQHRGHNAKVVAEIVGHSDVRMTLGVYTAATSDQMRAAVQSIDKRTG